MYSRRVINSIPHVVCDETYFVHPQSQARLSGQQILPSTVVFSHRNIHQFMVRYSRNTEDLLLHIQAATGVYPHTTALAIGGATLRKLKSVPRIRRLLKESDDIYHWLTLPTSDYNQEMGRAKRMGLSFDKYFELAVHRTYNLLAGGT